MKQKVVTMFYCDYCPKKGQRSYCIRLHEERCTRNPLRRCGVCGCQYNEGHVGALAKAAQEGLEALREFAGGCPVCMVIGINRAMLTLHGEPSDSLFEATGAPSESWYKEVCDFNLKKELDEWWREHNKEKARAYYGHW